MLIGRLQDSNLHLVKYRVSIKRTASMQVIVDNIQYNTKTNAVDCLYRYNQQKKKKKMMNLSVLERNP